MKAGRHNPSSADGGAVLRILGAIARNECEKTSDRIKRKAQKKAFNSEVWSIGSRPFGYKQGGMDTTHG